MADTPKPGHTKPVLERFEISETGLPAHLTDEQKTWKVTKLRPRSERFEVLTAQLTLKVKLHLTGSLSDADRVALAATILGVVQAVSEAERVLGGSGLVLADQQTEPRTVILTLRHTLSEGATARAAQLAEILNTAVNGARPAPSANLWSLLGPAAQSVANQMKLLLLGSHLVSQCEVLPPAELPEGTPAYK